jgi:hypothetical protein
MSFNNLAFLMNCVSISYKMSILPFLNFSMNFGLKLQKLFFPSFSSSYSILTSVTFSTAEKLILKAGCLFQLLTLEAKS